MICKKETQTALDKMILSASGWRGVFAESEESAEAGISEVHKIIFGAAAFVFAEYLRKSDKLKTEKNHVLLGTDTRPTGKAIADAMIPILLAAGCEVRYAGFTAAPEIMAWARSNKNAAGFIYISASHNPIGHNGLKFGLTDGGVLAAEEAGKLIIDFQSFLEKEENLKKIENIFTADISEKQKNVYANVTFAKDEALKAYYDFCGDVVWGDTDINGNSAIASLLKKNLASRPLGIVCDFNGSARTVSIDKDFFSDLGLKFKCINDKPAQIVHRIVPEGESLEPCKKLLEEAHKSDPAFVLGYVPDCDGDRGNLVIWDDSAGTARVLEAQEVFALACVAEFSQLVWAGGGKLASKTAVAINDPTSMRIDRIAESFGISVFRAEVGEANVVTLARRLRDEGFTVRILGEGSAGGNITHPSAVRDPINTVLAIVKLLSKELGLFEIWCKYSGQIGKYKTEFSLADIIESLPLFATTPAYSPDAVLQIKTKDPALLKSRYQKVFLREWEERKNELKAKYGFCTWEAAAYNGMEEKRKIENFADAGKGGLKIIFFNNEGKEVSFIWTRGSATEPVLRIMADIDFLTEKMLRKNAEEAEKDLLNWQRRMIMEADLNS